MVLLKVAVDNEHYSRREPGEVEAKPRAQASQARRVKFGEINRITRVHSKRPKTEQHQQRAKGHAAPLLIRLKQQDTKDQPAAMKEDERFSAAEPFANRPKC